MTDDLDELYHDLILDHNRQPRNFRAIEGARRAEGYNPLCGDRVTVYAQVSDGVIGDASFQGSGCAIAKASASMLTDAVKGLTIVEMEALFTRFHQMVTGPDTGSGMGLDKLSALAGVRQYPMRVKCASLAWHALRAAIASTGQVASTE